MSDAPQETAGAAEFPFLVPDRPLDRCLPRRIANAIAGHSALYGEPLINVVAVAVCLLAACTRSILRPASRNRRTTAMAFSVMPILPPGHHRAPWIDHMISPCRTLLEFNDAMHRAGITVQSHNMELGLVGFPASSPLANCLRPSELLRDPDPGGASTRLFVNPGVSVADELRRLSHWERGELLRLLSLAWEGEPLVTGDGRRALDVAMLAPVEGSAAREVLAWLNSAIVPPPVILLRSGASAPASGLSVQTFTPASFQDAVFLGRPDSPRPIALGADADAELERLEARINERLAELNRPVLSRHMRFVPGLIRRLAVLMAALCPDHLLEPRLEEAEAVAMAKGLALHIAAAHLEALRAMTSGFTAAPEDRTSDPVERFQEFWLLAKIRGLQPVTRTSLRNHLSDRQRRGLGRLLVSLIEQRKVETDARGRLRASREWS